MDDTDGGGGGAGEGALGMTSGSANDAADIELVSKVFSFENNLVIVVSPLNSSSSTPPLASLAKSCRLLRSLLSLAPMLDSWPTEAIALGGASGGSVVPVVMSTKAG